MEAVGADGYKCSLCDVTCTGTDAFNAHLKGAKHLKVSYKIPTCNSIPTRQAMLTVFRLTKLKAQFQKFNYLKKT